MSRKNKTYLVDYLDKKSKEDRAIGRDEAKLGLNKETKEYFKDRAHREDQEKARLSRRIDKENDRELRRIERQFSKEEAREARAFNKENF